jgi:single-strand DNA-binding protein
VCDFGLASGGTYKGKDGTEKSDVVFIDVVCFHQAAKYVAQYCRKGSSVLVEAKLQLDQWEDKNTGAKRSKHKLLANRVESMGSAKTEPAEEEF